MTTGGRAGRSPADDLEAGAPRGPVCGHTRGQLGGLRGRLLGGLVGGLCGLVVAGAALILLWRVAVRGPSVAARPDELLLVGLAWVGVVLAAWLAVGSLLAALCLLPGSAGRVATGLAERVTPLAVRRCLTLVLGAAVGSVALPAPSLSSAGSTPVATGTAVPADTLGTAGTVGTTATAGTASPEPARGAAGALTPGYAPTPGDRTPESIAVTTAGPGYQPTAVLPRAGAPAATTPAPPAPGYVPSAPAPVLDADRTSLLAPRPRAAAVTHDRVTVRRGDTLWGIAARHLGGDASDARVAAEWPRWYAANRAVIGEDPDLLVPGQQLRPPRLDPALRTEASEHDQARRVGGR